LATDRGGSGKAALLRIDLAEGKVTSDVEVSASVAAALHAGAYVAAGSHLVLLKDESVSVLPLCDAAAGQSESFDLRAKVKSTSTEPYRLNPWQQTPGVFAATNGAQTAIFGAGPDGSLKLLRVLEGAVVVGPVHGAHDDEAGQLVAVAVMLDDGAQIQLMDPASGNMQPAIHASGYKGSDHGPAKLLLVRELSSGEYRAVISAEDHSLAVIQGKNLAWVREEALATVQHATFYGRDASASMAARAPRKESGGIMAILDPALLAQFADIPMQMLDAVKKQAEGLAVLAGVDMPADSTSGRRIRNSELHSHATIPRSAEELRGFGADKLVLAATQGSKIFALEATTSEIVWQRYFATHGVPLADCVGITASAGSCGLWMDLLPSSSAPHSELLVVTPATSNGQDLIWLDPLTGNVLHKETFKTGSQVISVIPLAPQPGDKVMPFLIVDSNKQVTVMPPNWPSLEDHTERLFHYEVDRVSQDIRGYAMTKTEKSRHLTKIWNLELASVGEQIVAAAAPSHQEWDHVPVHIKGDASILYKYVNGNLLAVASEDVASKGNASSLNLYMMDAVTGHVVHQSRVPGGSQPVHLAVCDNWVVMHYWNKKKTRFEVTVVELFEAKPDDGPWNIVFGGRLGANQTKSAHYLDTPVALQQTYIFGGGGVNSIGVTSTLKGITPRSLIFALSTDHVLRVSKDVLNPRRPLPANQAGGAGGPSAERTIPSQFAATKEEQLMPYQPLLPMKLTEVMTHYNPVGQVQGIISSPTALESTSLVFCYGLDLFFTPVQTARAYDVLSPGFNYKFLYASVLVVLTLAIVTTYIAQYKALQDRWK